MRIRLIYILLLIILFHTNGVAQIRILSIGDSTMADYDEVKNSESKEKRGWAQMLPYFLTDDVQVDNAAKNGRSSKSFYFEFWGTLRETLKPGDYVVIQFGHNDEKNNGQDAPEGNPKDRGTAPWGQYQKYLKLYIDESRNRGAIPILATPVVRGLFEPDGKTLTAVSLHNLTDQLAVPNDSTMNYVQAMKAVARKTNVPLVDMTTLTKQLVTTYGPEKAKEIIYCQEDNTHLKALGGLLFAQLFAKNLISQNILNEYIRFPQTISITPDTVDFGPQLASIPSVKAISIAGMGLEAPSDIKLEVQSPFEISLHPEKDYQKEISITSSKNDLYIPVYIRFTASGSEIYNKSLRITTNGQKRNIKLLGSGIAVDKNKAIKIEISPVEGEKEPKVEGKVSAKLNISGLIYKNRVFTTPDEKWIEDEIDLNSSRYIELTITATEEVYINHLSFSMKSIGTDKMRFTALGSFDPAFSQVDSYAVMESISGKNVKTYSFDKMIQLPKSKTYRLRIYPWDKTGGNDKYLLLENITVKGLEARRR
ncbi:rhamnogalacturonan acetylesterase [Dysgonomonas sp.]